MKRLIVIVLCILSIVLISYLGIVFYLRAKVSNLVESATDPCVAYDSSIIDKNDYESLSQLLIQIGSIGDDGTWDLGGNVVLSSSLKQNYLEPVYYDFGSNEIIVKTSYSAEIEYTDESQVVRSKGGGYDFSVHLFLDVSDMRWKVSDVEVVYTFPPNQTI